jgi:hypothetical protein
MGKSLHEASHLWRRVEISQIGRNAAFYFFVRASIGVWRGSESALQYRP